MRYIGITGNKGSGKTTAARALEIICQPSFAIGIGDLVIQEVSLAINKKPQFILDNKEKFRLLLQAWAHEYRRQLYGEDYWLNKLEHAIHSAGEFKSFTTVIIPGIRMIRDVTWLKNKQGILIKMWRSYDATEDMHVTERELSMLKADHDVQNFGTLNELEHKLKYLWERIKND